MLRAQPLSFFEKLRSSVGVHCPHANQSTVWAFPRLFNVLLLWKTACPKCGNLILVCILGRLKSSLKSLTMCAPCACECPSLHICKTPEILLQRSLGIKRWLTPLTTWQSWMNYCLFQMAKYKLQGIWNFTNPRVVSHNEILEMYRQYIKPGFSWKNFTLEEQAKVIIAPWSNNEFNASKL